MEIIQNKVEIIQKVEMSSGNNSNIVSVLALSSAANCGWLKPLLNVLFDESSGKIEL